MPDRPASRKAGRVGGAMLPTDEYLHPDHPVAEAAARMRAAHLSMLPVVDGDEIVGIYTLAHMAQRKDQPPVPPAAEDARASRVGDHLTADIPYCYELDEIDIARQLLARHDLPWLLVVNQDDEYVGLISAEMASGARPARAAPRSAARHTRATGRARIGGETGAPTVYAERPKLRR